MTPELWVATAGLVLLVIGSVIVLAVAFIGDVQERIDRERGQ